MEGVCIPDVVYAIRVLDPVCSSTHVKFTPLAIHPPCRVKGKYITLPNTKWNLFNSKYNFVWRKLEFDTGINVKPHFPASLCVCEACYTLFHVPCDCFFWAMRPAVSQESLCQ